MRTISTLFINTLAQLIAKVATTGTTLVVTYLISSKLGTVGLGEFIATTSYVALFYLLADFGINAVFTKKIHKEESLSGLRLQGRSDPELLSKGSEFQNSSSENKLLFYFKNLLSIRLVLGIVVSFLAIAILSFLDYPANIKVAIILGSVLIFTQALFVTANGIFQIKLRYELSALSDIIGSLLTLFLVYLFLSSGLGVWFVILAYVAGSILKVLISLTLARRVVGGIGLGQDTSLWGSFFLASLPLGLIAIFSQIMANIDKVILSLAPLSSDLGYSNLEAVGIYGLAYKFFDVALVLPTYLMNAAFPIFVRTAREDTTKLKHLATKIGAALFGAALLLSVLGFFLAPVVLRFFNSGEDLSGSVAGLRVLLFGLPFFYLSALMVWLSVALDKQKQLILIYLLSALANLVLNLYLVPKFGFMASAYLTILSEIIIILGVGFMLWSFWRTDDQA